ncbi:AMP-binding protein [Streptomyces sp. NPDC059017]|uniref:AMP-binding protein n=1 Tax=unclassified Streptomyces TaxID=2593676 RepID=UPI0036ADFAAF
MTPPQGLALLDGGRAPEPDCATLGEALCRAAVSGAPEGLRFIGADGGETHRTYAELLDEAARLLAGIRAAGVSPAELVLLQIADTPDLVAAFWACVLGGFVPVLVGAGDTEAAPLLLDSVWTRYGRPPAITGCGVRIGADTRSDPRWAGAWLGTPDRLRRPGADRAWYPARPDDLALVLLTSGSSGAPKAVTLTHRNILSRSTANARAHALTSSTRSLNWMPLDHAGGLLLFHVRDVLVGAHQVHASRAWVLEDPLRWLDLADRHRVCTTWAPNFAFGLVNDQAHRLGGRGWDLSRLRYILNGGEAVRGAVVRRFLDLLAPFGLPADAMFPGWGMSETAAGVVECRFPGPGAEEERYVAVGRPQPGTAVRCVDAAGRTVPLGTPGHLQVTGASVTHGYYDDAAQNRRSFTADGWFRTGDLAYVKDGVLTVTGRADDVIEGTGSGPGRHGHEVEAVAEELDFVTPSYTVASTVTVAGRDGLAVFFHPRNGGGPGSDASRAAAAIRERVADRLGLRVDHVVPLSKDDVPKTGAGKLRRTRLRRWFESGGAGIADPGTADERNRTGLGEKTP